MKKLRLATLLCVYLFSMITHTTAQVFSNKEVGKKNVALADSLKKTEWPFLLPILGKKVSHQGYNLPFPVGLSSQVFSQKSDLILDNLQVGFNNGPMYSLDELLRFDKAESKATAITIRPDIWLLPFLNVYGIFGRASASTDINAGFWIKDENGNDMNIAQFATKVEFNTTTYGVGMTPTIGIGGGFLAVDMNVAWSDVPQLEKPAQTFVLAPRLGKAFKLNKPNQVIAIWIGGFRAKLNSETNGSLALSEVFPSDGSFQEKIDQAEQKVAQTQQQVDTWWAGLTQNEQKNPINIAKYERANSILTKASNFLTAAESAGNIISNSTVQYSMDKRVKDPWNFIAGTQFQLNKHWMARFELGFLGSRTQILGGIQWRFGLR